MFVQRNAVRCFAVVKITFGLVVHDLCSLALRVVAVGCSDLRLEHKPFVCPSSSSVAIYVHRDCQDLGPIYIYILVHGQDC